MHDYAHKVATGMGVSQNNFAKEALRLHSESLQSQESHRVQCLLGSLLPGKLYIFAQAQIGRPEGAQILKHLAAEEAGRIRDAVGGWE